jgi:hypothetical protein
MGSEWLRVGGKLEAERSLRIVEREKAITKISVLINESSFVITDRTRLEGWRYKCQKTIDAIFGEDSTEAELIASWDFRYRKIGAFPDEEMLREDFRSKLESATALLAEMRQRIHDDGFPAEDTISQASNAVDSIERICFRFHSVCRQLRERHDSRGTLDVRDEYDMQDLLHSLLLLHFDDIRPEEWTPSYAGGSARVDFLLKGERIVIECKMARAGLNARKLGEELIIDIARYEHHPGCGLLVCFVYDPDGKIKNPRGIENDLSKIRDGFSVKVIISPIH